MWREWKKARNVGPFSTLRGPFFLILGPSPPWAEKKHTEETFFCSVPRFIFFCPVACSLSRDPRCCCSKGGSPRTLAFASCRRKCRHSSEDRPPTRKPIPPNERPRPRRPILGTAALCGDGHLCAPSVEAPSRLRGETMVVSSTSGFCGRAEGHPPPLRVCACRLLVRVRTHGGPPLPHVRMLHGPHPQVRLVEPKATQNAVGPPIACERRRATNRWQSCDRAPRSVWLAALSSLLPSLSSPTPAARPQAMSI